MKHLNNFKAGCLFMLIAAIYFSSWSSAQAQCTVTITPDGPLTVCPASGRNLTATADFTSYWWSTGETTQSINYPNGNQTYNSLNITSGTQNTYFEVKDPANNSYYIHNAQFSVNDVGQIVYHTSQTGPWTITPGAGTDYILQPGVTVPGNFISVSVAPTGEVWAMLPNTVYPVQIGWVQLSYFINLSDLTPVGFDLYQNTSGLWPNVGTPGVNGYGLIENTLTATVTAIDNNGCIADASVTITGSLPDFSITASGPTTICPGTILQLDAGLGQLSYKWATGDNTEIVNFPEPNTEALNLNVVNGPGFFQLQSYDGTTVYLAPPAQFILSSTGVMEYPASNGLTYPLIPGITIPMNFQSIEIEGDGNVKVRLPNQVLPVIVGRIQLATFQYPQNLSAITENIYIETAYSGQPNVDDPGLNGKGLLSHPLIASVNVVAPNGCPGSASITLNTGLTGVTISPSMPVNMCRGAHNAITAGGGYASYHWNDGEYTQSIDFTGNYYPGDNLYLSVLGTGYLRVMDPLGIFHYLRDGEFYIDEQGRITYDNYGLEYLLDPQITVPPNFISLTINSDGQVSCIVNGSTTPQVLGQIQLYNFNDPMDDLLDEGEGLYLQIDGNVISATPCTPGFGIIITKYKEVVQVTDVNGCSGSASVLITQVPPIPAPVINSSEHSYICAGNQLSLGTNDPLYFDCTGGDVSYQWSNGATTQYISVSTSGTYTVTVTNSWGCSASSNSIQLTVLNPVADVGNDISICSGNSVQISATASGGLPDYTYTWQATDGSLSDLNSPSPVATPLATTTYTLSVNDMWGCIASANLVVTVNPSVTILDGSGSSTMAPVCAGTSIVINNGNPIVSAGSGTYSYQWTSSPSSTIDNIANPTVSPTTATTYNVTVNDADGCSATAAILLPVNPVPVISAPDQSICSGNSAILGGDPTASDDAGIASYTWIGSDGSTYSDANPTVSPTSTTTYTLTVMNVVGCTSGAAQVVTVNSAVVASAGASQTICYGTSTQIGDNPTASGGTDPYSYQWSASDNSTIDNISNPTVSPQSDASYNLVVTDANGCSAGSSTTITVGAPVTVEAGRNATVCEGGTVYLGGNPTAQGAGTYTFSWSSPSELDNANSSNPTATPAASTIYNVTVTDISNGCTASDRIVVNVKPLPTASAGNDVVVCSGSPISAGGNPTAHGGSGPYNYLWSSSADDDFHMNDANPVFTADETTVYTIIVTDANGCTSAASFNATVNPSPTAFAGNNGVYCLNPVALGGTPTAGAGTGSYQYNWYPTAGLDASDISNPNASPIQDMVYSLTVTDFDGCTATASVSVTTGTGFASIQPVGPLSIHDGGYVSINVPGSFDSYTWTSGETTSSIDYAGTHTLTDNFTLSPLCNGYFVVDDMNSNELYLSGGLLSVDGSGNVIYTDNSLIYNLQFIPTNSLGTQSLILPLDVTSFDISSDGTVTINENGSYTVIGQIVLATFANPSSLPSVGTNLYDATNVQVADVGVPLTGTRGAISIGSDVGVIVTSNGCSSNATVHVTRFPAISIPAITVSGSAVVCAGGSVVLNAPSPTSFGLCQGTIAYNWSSGQTSQSITVTQSGDYTVTVTNGYGNTASSLPFTVIIGGLTADAGINKSICSGDYVEIGGTTTATGGTPPYSYQWSGPFLDGNNTANPYASPQSTTVYTLTVTDSRSCHDIKTTTVSVNTNLKAFAGNDVTVCSGATATLGGQPSASCGSGYYFYDWTPRTGLDNWQVANPVASPTSTTIYTLVVSDDQGSTATSNVTVSVNPSPSANAGAGGMINTASFSLGGNPSATGGTPPYSYLWTSIPGLSINNPHAANPVVTPQDNSSYTLQVTDSRGCSSLSLVDVTIPPIFICAHPFLILTDDAGNLWPETKESTCGGFTASVPCWNLLYDPNSYHLTWTVFDPFYTVVAQINSGLTSQHFNLPPNEYEMDVHLVRNSDDVVIDSRLRGFEILAAPVCNITTDPSNGINCNGRTITFSTPSQDLADDSGPFDDFIYNWTFGDGTPDINGLYNTPGVPSSTHTYPAGPGNYTACLTITEAPEAQNCPPCSTCVPIQIMHNPNITLTYTETGCGNYTFTATTDCFQGPITFTWSVGGVTLQQTVAPGNTSVFQHNFTTHVDVVVRATHTMNGNLMQADQQIFPNIVFPTVSHLPNINVCANGCSDPIALSGTPNNLSYSWSASSNNYGLVTIDPTHVEVCPTQTTTFTVRGTDVNGCTASTSFKATVRAHPTVTIAAGPCINGSRTITASTDAISFPNAPGFHWSTQGNITPGNPQLNFMTGRWSEDAVVRPTNAATIYSVTVTDQFGCTGTASITLDPCCVPPTLNVSPNISLCSGEPDYTVYATSPFNSMVWSNNAPTPTVVAQIGSYKSYFVLTPPYQSAVYTVVVTGAFGCTNSATVTVTAYTSPTVTVTAGNCNGGNTVITATTDAISFPQPPGFNWLPQSNITVGNPSLDFMTGHWSESATVNPGTATTYTVTVTDEHGCSVSGSIDVEPCCNVNVPVINGPTCFSYGDQDNYSIGNVQAGVTYTWSVTGAGYTGGTIGNLTQITGDWYNALNGATGAVITVTATDDNNPACTATATLTAYINPTVSLTQLPCDVNGCARVRITTTNKIFVFWNPQPSSFSAWVTNNNGTFSRTATYCGLNQPTNCSVTVLSGPLLQACRTQAQILVNPCDTSSYCISFEEFQIPDDNSAYDGQTTLGYDQQHPFIQFGPGTGNPWLDLWTQTSGTPSIQHNGPVNGNIVNAFDGNQYLLLGTPGGDQYPHWSEGAEYNHNFYAGHCYTISMYVRNIPITSGGADVNLDLYLLKNPLPDPLAAGGSSPTPGVPNDAYHVGGVTVLTTDNNWSLISFNVNNLNDHYQYLWFMVDQPTDHPLQSDAIGIDEICLTDRPCCPALAGASAGQVKTLDWQQDPHQDGRYYITTSQTWNSQFKYHIADNTTVVFQGNITVDLTDIDAVFGTNAGFEFDNSAYIRANNSVFRPCDVTETWNGFVFNDDASGIIDESLFKNAIVAVHVKGAGDLRIDNNNFSNCQTGIYLEPSDNVYAQGITGNTFLINSDNPISIVSSNAYFYGIMMYNTTITGVVSQNDFVSQFDNNTGAFYDFFEGIYAQGCTFTASSNKFTDMNCSVDIYGNLGVCQLSNNTFETTENYVNIYPYLIDVFVQSCTNYDVLIQDNTFDYDKSTSYFEQAIGAYASSNVNVVGNTFNNFKNATIGYNQCLSPGTISENKIFNPGTTGIALWQSGDGITVEGNFIQGNYTSPIQGVGTNSATGIGVTVSGNDIQTLRVIGNCIYNMPTSIAFSAVGAVTNYTIPDRVDDNWMYNYTNAAIAITGVTWNGTIGVCSNDPDQNYWSGFIPPLGGAVDILCATGNTVTLAGFDPRNTTISSGGGTVNFDQTCDEYCRSACQNGGHREDDSSQAMYSHLNNYASGYYPVGNDGTNYILNSNYMSSFNGITDKFSYVVSLMNLLSQNSTKEQLDMLYNSLKSSVLFDAHQKQWLEYEYYLFTKNFQQAYSVIQNIYAASLDEQELISIEKIRLPYSWNGIAILSTPLSDMNTLNGIYQNGNVYSEYARNLMQLIQGYPLFDVRVANGISYTVPPVAAMFRENDITVYPNPTSGGLTIYYSLKNNDGKLRLTDITGRVINVYNVSSNTGNISIDISDIANGVYFLWLYTDNKMIKSVKVIKD